MNHEDTKTVRRIQGGYKRIPFETEQIATEVVDATYAVHVEMRTGLLESVYEECLVRELGAKGIAVERQKEVPLQYKGEPLSERFRLDLLVSNSVICEVKSVVEMHPVYKAQLLSYLKLTDLRLGLLISFNVKRIKDGITRVVL